MVGVTDEIKSSWADEVEGLGGGELPPSTEVMKGDYKIITEYKYDDNDKKVMIVKTYKIEKRIVSKSMALRKTWPKYGGAKDDKPGPNPATTIIGEDVFMQFITSKEEADKPEEDALDKLKNLSDKSFKCRTCNGDHWSHKCMFKDTNFKPLDDKPKNSGTTSPTPTSDDKSKTGKYVPPVLRDGGSGRRPDGTMIRRDEQQLYPIRISHLSEATQDQDLEELVRQFGPYGKIFLAKEHSTGKCKGYAFVHFKHKNDAYKAISTLNGYGYDHLILQVDWSRPTGS